MNKLLSAAAALLLAASLSGCGNHSASGSRKPKSPPETVADLAYSADNTSNYRIFLKENNSDVPFLVLTSDYGGNCLLLREYVTDQPIKYNDPCDYGSYYGESYIDRYLNDTYYTQLSSSLQSQIAVSSVPIATKHAIDTHDEETETISRKIFLLSGREINAPIGRSMIKEGKELPYFREESNRVAYNSSGEPKSWMLRSAALVDSSTVFGVAKNGVVGSGGINGTDGAYTNNVRPAFCLPCDLPVSACTISGQQAFCLSQNT